MKTFSLLLLLGVFYLGCKSDGTNSNFQLEEKNGAISKLEMEMAQPGAETDPKKMEELLMKYEDYVKTYPEKEGSNAAYLLKAAEIANYLKRSDKAINYYSYLIGHYAKNEKVDRAYFMKAFTYEKYLQKQDSAKFFYEEYVRRFPAGEFADDAQFSLKNLGKTDEEVVKEFEAQQPKLEEKKQ